MSSNFRFPPERDYGFYQRRKHDKWREVPVPEPALEAPVADSHAHLQMLPDPAWELARCAANGVRFVSAVVDLSEYGTQPFDDLPCWLKDVGDELVPPTVSITAGVHPHNAKLYDEKIEQKLLECMADSRVTVLGEIGLDYYYDLSPRDVQRRVFKRQVQLAKEAGFPVALHLRSGQDPQADNAHREALEILQEMGFPECGTLLHCCALPPDELQPWIDADCYIAYGGSITFKNVDAAREAVRLVPYDRLLFETDAPFMTPEPMRGTACTPAHVIFTAAALAEICGKEPGAQRKEFLQTVYNNTLNFFLWRE